MYVFHINVKSEWQACTDGGAKRQTEKVSGAGSQGASQLTISASSSSRASKSSSSVASPALCAPPPASLPPRLRLRLRAGVVGHPANTTLSVSCLGTRNPVQAGVGATRDTYRDTRQASFSSSKMQNAKILNAPSHNATKWKNNLMCKIS